MKHILIPFLIIAVAFSSCKKKPDEPPTRNLGEGKFYSVAELRSIATCTNGCSNRFSDADYFKGVVIADELSGNFYKEMYVRDAQNTGGIHMTFTVSGSNLFVGDSVRLNLKGYDVNLNSSSGLLEIDSVNFEKNVVRFASGANPQPRVLSLSDISPSNPYSNYHCDLVTITRVSFVPGDQDVIWADPILQQSLNRTLQDCGGNQVVVRTSNYASFAQQKTPTGFGSITGIATAYGTTNQMAIRQPSEVDMNGVSTCFTYLQKTFNDNSLTSGGWVNQNVTDPSVNWLPSAFSGSVFAKCSGFYSSANHNAETWLISPAIDLNASFNPVLTFRTAASFTGSPLEVWASVNYTSGAPSTATWVQLTGFALSPMGGYVWTNSGAISLSQFKNANARVAFKYMSTTTGATTYELDDIVVREN